MKTIVQMQAETVEVETLLGWKGPDVVPNSFGDSMSLLHSEVSEAFEAFRNWRLKDATMIVEDSFAAVGAPIRPGAIPKPEGVGSEFADILIRLLSSCDQYGIDIEAEYERKVAYNRTRSFRHGGKAL